jgi:urease accessory protein
MAAPALGSLLLLLLDSRSPSGGHNHSGGMEPAVAAGLVRDLDDVEDFCRGRLRTAGRVAAGFAAASCQLWLDSAGSVDPVPNPTSERREEHQIADEWALLDAEFDARNPSEAVRAASRQLGHGLRRLLRATVPDADLSVWEHLPAPAPHHPLVLGAGVALAGGSSETAARAAALAAVSVPASAAVRLLGLDPFAVQAMLARLTPSVDECGSMTGLPADAAPWLDLLADHHLTTEVRLFAS